MTSTNAFQLSKSLTVRHSPAPPWWSDEQKQEQQQDEEGESTRNEVAREVPYVAALELEDRWSNLLPELLRDIVRRVEASEDRWPLRKSVVTCACVCRRWREVTIGVVGPPGVTGKITFPSSLKQPGPRDLPIQCFVKRNKKRSTFYLFLSLTQTFMDKGKFLLAARRYSYGSHAEYIISLDADDLSQSSNAYIGKLRSDFLGTKFTIYDRRSPYRIKASSNQVTRCLSSKKISPHVPGCNFEIGQVTYKFNLMKTRTPRRMLCTMQCPVNGDEEQGEPEKMSKMDTCGLNVGYLVLKNKAPRWHERLQCWCLNFHGRVSVASVKNFQLVATSDPSQPRNIGDEETVILQFGKLGKDIFTMDYREPLSAFQAFAICLTSFGTKFACE